jgi:hypothetical protein
MALSDGIGCWTQVKANRCVCCCGCHKPTSSPMSSVRKRVHNQRTLAAQNKLAPRTRAPLRVREVHCSRP